MDISSKKLIYKFKEISKKGWIENKHYNSWGAIGLTFENEIGKKTDAKYLPDFENIEIKCSTRYSMYPLYLFTIAFDGPSDNEILRLADKFGYYDKDFPDKKVMFRKITNEINSENKYNFYLEPDLEKELFYLAVYDNYGDLIEKESYVKFSTLKEHLDTKLKTLAVIKASKKESNKKTYFRYYEMKLYKIKSFKRFIDLIISNELEISIISRISKSGSDIGRYRNKNLVFSIPKDKIYKLYDCYYQYHGDLNIKK